MTDQQPAIFMSDLEAILYEVYDLQTDNAKLRDIIGKQQEQLKSNQEFMGVLIEKMEERKSDITTSQKQCESSIEAGLAQVRETLRKIGELPAAAVAPDSKHTEVNSNN